MQVCTANNKLFLPPNKYNDSEPKAGDLIFSISEKKFLML